MRRWASLPRASPLLSVLVFAGPKRIGELARIEQVEPPTMTRLVDGLVRDGLAMREPDPDDARAVRVRATADRCSDAAARTRERASRPCGQARDPLPRRARRPGRGCRGPGADAPGSLDGDARQPHAPPTQQHHVGPPPGRRRRAADRLACPPRSSRRRGAGAARRRSRSPRGALRAGHPPLHHEDDLLRRAAVRVERGAGVRPADGTDAGSDRGPLRLLRIHLDQTGLLDAHTPARGPRDRGSRGPRRSSATGTCRGRPSRARWRA